MELVTPKGTKISLDTSDPPHTSKTFTPFCEGWDNMNEELNEVIQQFFYLCGEGFARNYVTGMAPALTVTGHRVVGDPLQDWMFDFKRKYGTGATRETTMRVERPAATKAEKFDVPVTICNLVEIGGSTNDGMAISAELRFNGKPQIAVE